MKLLSRHFQDVEFFCHCGSCDPHEVKINTATVMALQRVRSATGQALKITSGVRCKAHNESIDGAAKNSWHVPRETSKLRPQLVSYAADFTYSNPDLRTPGGILKLYVMASQDTSVTGLGLYSGRIHLDTRPEGRARWIDKSWLDKNWEEISGYNNDRYGKGTAPSESEAE